VEGDDNILGCDEDITTSIQLGAALLGFKVTLETYRQGEPNANFCKFFVKITDGNLPCAGRDPAANFYKLPYIKQNGLKPYSRTEITYLQCKLVSFYSSYPHFTAFAEVVAACKEDVAKNSECGGAKYWFLSDDGKKVQRYVARATKVLHRLDYDLIDNMPQSRRNRQFDLLHFPPDYVERVNCELRKYARHIRDNGRYSVVANTDMPILSDVLNHPIDKRHKPRNDIGHCEQVVCARKLAGTTDMPDYINRTMAQA